MGSQASNKAMPCRVRINGTDAEMSIMRCFLHFCITTICGVREVEMAKVRRDAGLSISAKVNHAEGRQEKKRLGKNRIG